MYVFNLFDLINMRLTQTILLCHHLHNFLTAKQTVTNCFSAHSPTCVQTGFIHVTTEQ